MSSRPWVRIPPALCLSAAWDSLTRESQARTPLKAGRLGSPASGVSARRESARADPRPAQRDRLAAEGRGPAALGRRLQGFLRVANLREQIRDLRKGWGRSSAAQSARLSGERPPVRVRSSPLHGGRGVTASIQGCEPCGVGSSPTGYPSNEFSCVARADAEHRRAQRAVTPSPQAVVVRLHPSAPLGCLMWKCPAAADGGRLQGFSRVADPRRSGSATAQLTRGPVAGGQQVHFAP
jgi:hypothetical protein